jgi:hypothetical protein
MARSFRSNTFYNTMPPSSRGDFGRHSCLQENRRCLAGLSPEETIEFEALEALPPFGRQRDRWLDIRGRTDNSP